MKKIRIIKTTSKDPEILEFLRNTFSSPTHWPHWNNVVSNYFNSEFFYEKLILNDEVYGINPVHLQRKGILRFEYSGQFNFIPYGGWLLKNNDYRNFKIYYNHFLTERVTFEFPRIKVSEDLAQLNTNFKETLIVNLSKDLDRIWNEDIESKRRNMIRKAEKNKVKVTILKNKFSNDWFNLYKLACEQNKLKSLSENFFLDLFNNNGEISFLIFNAYFDDRILANVIIVYDKNYAIYWLGNYEKKINLGQGELIQWEAIKMLKQLGVEIYDLCYIEKDRLPNIYEFKKGFSNTVIKIPIIINKSLSFKIINKISSVIRLL